MFENPRRGRQARNFTTNVPKILDLKSSSEQIFSENCRWVPLRFHMPGKSQTIGDFTVSRLSSQILPTNENSKSQISPIVWDGRAQIWRIGSVSIFPMRPRFLRWSTIITQICTVGDVGDGFRSLPVL